MVRNLKLGFRCIPVHRRHVPPLLSIFVLTVLACCIQLLMQRHRILGGNL